MGLQQPEPPGWWRFWVRWKLRRQRQQRQRFSLSDWEPGTGGLDKGQQRYILLRWASSIELMDKRHRHDVSMFYILRTLSILGGVAVTALSGIGLSSTSSSAGIRWTIFALGFLVAGSAGLEQIGHYGQHRVLSRQAREQLLSVGFGYLLPTAAKAGFNQFRKQVEDILRIYNQSYDRTISDNS